MDGAAERVALLPRTIQKLAASWRFSWDCTLDWILDDGLEADDAAADATSIANAITATLADMTFRLLEPMDATNGNPLPFRTRARRPVPAGLRVARAPSAGRG